jgi:hypothetical protein
LLLYGWGAQKRLHWIVPDIGLFCIGLSMILIFQASTSYMIDTFTLHAASALAATICLRSICGFAFPLVSRYCGRSNLQACTDAFFLLLCPSRQFAPYSESASRMCHRPSAFLGVCELTHLLARRVSFPRGSVQRDWLRLGLFDPGAGRSRRGRSGCAAPVHLWRADPDPLAVCA